MFLPLGHEQITTTLSAAVGLARAGSAVNAVRALIQAESQAIRWRDDGTDPTATVGMRLQAGESLAYEGDLSAIKFIREASGAVLNVAYYSQREGDS